MSIYYEPGTEGLGDPTHHLKAALEAVAATARALKEERDEAIADRDIARLSAQDSDKAHDRMVGELEKVYKERDEAREALREIQAANWRTAGELRCMARRALEGVK